MTQPIGETQPQAHVRVPFAARFQGLLIVVMFVSLAMIAQQSEKQFYKIGLPVLMVAAFLQIAFGNIPPKANFKRSMVLLAITWVIVGGIFFLAVILAPTMIEATK